MYVELDTSETARKKNDVDMQALKNEITRLSDEKMAYYEQLRQRSMVDNESQVRQMQALNNEQSSKIEKIKSEKDALNKELVETKMRTAKEKEELATRLGLIEKEIVRREREAYEIVLAQSCEAVRADEARKYAALCEQIKQK